MHVDRQLDHVVHRAVADAEAGAGAGADPLVAVGVIVVVEYAPLDQRRPCGY